MAAVAGYGIAPIGSLTPVMKGLFNERLYNDAAAKQSLMAAPVTETDSLSGSYEVDTTFQGVDLSKYALQTDAVPLNATEFPDLVLSTSTQTFECKRRQIGRYDVADAAQNNWLAQGIDYAARMVTRSFQNRAAAIHSLLSWTVVGTGGNWDSNHTYDPGNLTTTSFDLIDALDDVRDLLLDSQRYRVGDPINVCVGDDVMKSLFLLDQVRNAPNSVGQANAYADFDGVANFFARWLPGAKLHWIQDRYKAASGTVTPVFAAKVAFLLGDGSAETPTFARTFIPSSQGGDLADFRDERIVAMPGTRYYGDMIYGVDVSDNQAGILWTTVLT